MRKLLIIFVSTMLFCAVASAQEPVPTVISIFDQGILSPDVYLPQSATGDTTGFLTWLNAGRKEVCTPAACLPFPEEVPILSMIQFSAEPEGSRIALTLNVAIGESDLWILAPFIRSFENLTDDDIRGAFYELTDVDYESDHFPLWADPGTLYFFRHSDLFSGEPEISLMQINPNGESMPEVVHEFGAELINIIKVALSPDGQQLAILHSNRTDEGRRGLVTIYNIDDFEDSRTIVLSDLDARMPEFTDPAEYRLEDIDWQTDDQLMLTVLDYAGAVFRNFIRVPLSDGEQTAYFDYSNYTQADLSAYNEADNTTGRDALPRQLVLSQDGEPLYYVSIQASNRIAILHDAENGNPLLEFELNGLHDRVEDYVVKLSNTNRALIVSGFLLELE